MHYYKRNIGDYHKKAGRLSILQHGTYTLLIDACYDREKFPTESEAIDWCWASTDEEIGAVKFVLRRFFEEIDGIFVQKRIQEEIEAYRAKSLKNKEIALKRESDKRANRDKKSTKRAQGVNESPPNHKPITNNHKPNNTCALFDSFWALYPRKTGKKDARRAWDKIKPDTELFAKIQTHIGQQYPEGYDKAFIPHPATYLNKERWTDEIIARPEVETKLKLPADDQLESFAQKNLLPMANPGENYFEYRRRLQGILDRRAD